MGLIEVVIAIFLTTVGVLAIFSLQGTGWKTAARSDYLGRAAEIMYRQLELTEYSIMNPCQPVTVGTTTAPAVLTSGGGAAITGDASYNVVTQITNIGTNIWRVNVTVTWTGNTTGITGSVVVSRQEYFKVGC
jgi:Tfp pilus assembly protein PilV